MRLAKEGGVSTAVVLHVDETFGNGRDQGLSRSNPGRSHHQPTGFAVVRRLPIFSRLGCGDLTISQQAVPWPSYIFTATAFPSWLTRDYRLNESDAYEPFRSHRGHLMWMVNETRPNILNKVRVVVRYFAANILGWHAMLLIVVMYIKHTSIYSVRLRRSPNIRTSIGI